MMARPAGELELLVRAEARDVTCDYDAPSSVRPILRG